jgi:L-cysteate sulfo-lyase
VTPAAREAMRLAARTEGIFLDPTYTARALAGLITRVGDGRIKRQDRTVFMHTGGLPGLFGHPDFMHTGGLPGLFGHPDFQA